MREIKFRAWDNINKKWELGYQYPNVGGFSMKGEVMMFGEYSRVLNSYPIEKWDDFIITQYTGLKDKNNKDIYEGDIVRVPYTTPFGDLTDDEDLDLRTSIAFEHGSFVLSYPKTNSVNIDRYCIKEEGKYVANYGNQYIISSQTVLEVIGNIYETNHITN